MPVLAVSFDADQTLWDFRGVYRKALDATVLAMIEHGYVAAVTRLLHVGDDLDDVDGANGVGATSVWINRAGTSPPWADRADHQIQNLQQLESLLNALD